MAHLPRHGSKTSWRSSTLRSVKLRRGFLWAPHVGHLLREEFETVRYVRLSHLLGKREGRLEDPGPASGRSTRFPKQRPLAPGVAASAGGRRRSLHSAASAAR